MMIGKIVHKISKFWFSNINLFINLLNLLIINIIRIRIFNINIINISLSFNLFIFIIDKDLFISYE